MIRALPARPLSLLCALLIALAPLHALAQGGGPAPEVEGGAPGAPPEDEAPAVPAPGDSWEQALRDGVNAYVSVDYNGVIQRLEPWSRPPFVDEIPEARRLRLLELLAVTYLLQTPPQVEPARATMGRLLGQDPGFTFSEGLNTAEAVRLLEDVREEMGIEPPQSQQPQSQTLYIQREVVQHQFALVFFPFGVGQFQNGQADKGLFFLLTQAGALGTNVVSFFIVEQLRNERGLYSPEGARSARVIQTVQLTSWWIFVGLLLGGIADAWYFYQDEQAELRTLDNPPPEFFDTSPPPGASLQAPALPPTLSWGWRF